MEDSDVKAKGSRLDKSSAKVGAIPCRWKTAKSGEEGQRSVEREGAGGAGGLEDPRLTLTGEGHGQGEDTTVDLLRVRILDC